MNDLLGLGLIALLGSSGISVFYNYFLNRKKISTDKIMSETELLHKRLLILRELNAELSLEITNLKQQLEMLRDENRNLYQQILRFRPQE